MRSFSPDHPVSQGQPNGSRKIQFLFCEIIFDHDESLLLSLQLHLSSQYFDAWDYAGVLAVHSQFVQRLSGV
jgi:hypothetical protein